MTQNAAKNAEIKQEFLNFYLETKYVNVSVSYFLFSCNFKFVYIQREHFKICKDETLCAWSTGRIFELPHLKFSNWRSFLFGTVQWRIFCQSCVSAGTNFMLKMLLISCSVKPKISIKATDWFLLCMKNSNFPVLNEKERTRRGFHCSHS